MDVALALAFRAESWLSGMSTGSAQSGILTLTPFSRTSTTLTVIMAPSLGSADVSSAIASSAILLASSSAAGVGANTEKVRPSSLAVSLAPVSASMRRRGRPPGPTRRERR